MNAMTGLYEHYVSCNALKAAYESNGFDIIATPTNQFGLQEPGANSEIMNQLTYVRPGNGFVPNYELSVKIEVNGARPHPLFTFMKVWQHLFIKTCKSIIGCWVKTKQSQIIFKFS